MRNEPVARASVSKEAAVNGILIACLYAPNGNPKPGPKFEYKLAWMRRLREHAQTLLAAKIPVALLGDFNVVPTERDIYPTRSWDKDALVQPESRAEFARLMDQGWLDAVRALHPDQPMYTFWDYMRNRWARDAGLRIDHLLLSPTLAPRLEAAGVPVELSRHDGLIHFCFRAPGVIPRSRELLDEAADALRAAFSAAGDPAETP